MACIAFDFDGCFDDIRIQVLAKKLVQEGNEIWIVTARKENQFSKDIVLNLAGKIGISEYRVIYANEKPKFDLLNAINADIYIDNISLEFEKIKNYSNTIPLLW